MRNVTNFEIDRHPLLPQIKVEILFDDGFGTWTFLLSKEIIFANPDAAMYEARILEILRDDPDFQAISDEQRSQIADVVIRDYRRFAPEYLERYSNK